MRAAQFKTVTQSQKQFRLGLVFFVHKLGWGRLLLLCLILKIGTAWWRGVPYMQKQNYLLEEQLTDLQAKRLQLNQTKPSPALDANAQRLHAFYELLGERKHLEQQVKTILYLANESGVSLKAGEYQLVENHAGKYFTYKIQLPVRGNYQQIRKFAEQVLLTVPFAAMDEISFKREAINGAVIESKIVFALYASDIAAVTGPVGGFE